MKKCLHLFFFISFSTSAQVSLNGSCGNVSNSTGSVNYSVGQVYYKTIIGSDSNLNEGVQQPYEIFVLSNQNFDSKFLNILVYPNPTKDFLILDYKDLDFYNHTYELFDFTGRLLQKEKVNNKVTTLNIEIYPSSTYLLVITDGKNLIKNFKIIKN